MPIVIDTFDQVFLGPRSDTWLVQQFAFYGIKGTTDMLLFIIMVTLSGLIFVWTFFRELRIHIFGFDKISRIEGFQNFVGTKYRQNGQKWRKSRKINPLQVDYFLYLNKTNSIFLNRLEFFTLMATEKCIKTFQSTMEI